MEATNERYVDFWDMAMDEASRTSTARMLVTIAMLSHPGSVREIAEATGLDMEAVQHILDAMQEDGEIEDAGRLTVWAEFKANAMSYELAERTGEGCRGRRVRGTVRSRRKAART